MQSDGTTGGGNSEAVTSTNGGGEKTETDGEPDDQLVSLADDEDIGNDTTDDEDVEQDDDEGDDDSDAEADGKPRRLLRCEGPNATSAPSRGSRQSLPPNGAMCVRRLPACRVSLPITTSPSRAKKIS